MREQTRSDGTPARSGLPSVEERLSEAERRFRVVFDLSPLAMGLTLGETGTYAVVNGALCELLGRSAEELVGMSARELLHADDVELADAAGAAAAAAADGRHRLEMRLLRKDGEVLTTWVTLAWVAAGDGARYLLAQIEDITARRAAEDMLRRQAELDGLTGLANRARLNRVLGELAAGRHQVAVLFLDLDGFKVVNDTRGHDVGDQVLVEVARRVSALVRRRDLVARFGGDELVVICGGGPDASALHVDRVAAGIERALVRPIDTDAGPVRVTASIGLATGRVDAGDPLLLVQRADAAMYRAKSLGKNRRESYGPHLHRQTAGYRRTEASLRHALDEDRFRVHYQPIVDVRSGDVVGVEALVRLLDEHGHLVLPGAFIPAAEQSGLVVPMGVWVLRESCRAVAALRAETGADLHLAVNVAASQVSRPDLAETVAAALADAGLPERALSLELTESALFEADDLTLRQLVDLRDRGVGISLDDFGTGYSSLAHLRRFPVTELKVDRSFVQAMVTSTSDRAIVAAITRLADDLGMGWVAEGVETADQHRAVASLGAGRAQGYLFGRPAPVAVLRARLPHPGSQGLTA